MQAEAVFGSKAVVKGVFWSGRETVGLVGFGHLIFYKSCFSLLKQSVTCLVIVYPSYIIKIIKLLYSMCVSTMFIR